MGGGMMGGYGGLGLLGGLFGLLVTVGLVVVLVLLGVWLWHRLSSTTGVSAGAQPPAARPQSAREILQERYARGELSREEYQVMLQDLS